MRDILLEVQPFLTLLVLVVALAGTFFAIRVLQTTSRILRLSERRMHYLAEEQYRLKMLREDYRLLEKTLTQERMDRLVARKKVPHLEHLWSPRKQ